MLSELLKANTRDRERFLRELVSELALTLQEVVGMKEAEGFVKIVGLKIGQAINDDYNSANANRQWTIHQLADVLVDLKLKIDGGFTVESVECDRIVSYRIEER